MFLALWSQASVIGLLALILGVASGWFAGVSLLYGGAVAMLNAGLLVRRWRGGLTDFHCDAARHLKSFQRSMLERFFMATAFLAAGMAGFGLDAPAMLMGFIVGQIAWVIAAAVLKNN